MAKEIMKLLQFFLLIFLLIFLSGCAKKIDGQTQTSIYIGKNLIKINAEIADDNLERENGLMFREHLNENSGMLFMFENEEQQTFWMKNTLIPLDIIFIDNAFKIIDIKYAIPCDKDPCRLYESTKPAKYVLEMNGNFTSLNNIKIGDSLILN